MCLAQNNVNKKIRFGSYQSCGNMESVGSVFGLRWCGWCRWEVDIGFEPWSGRVR